MKRVLKPDQERPAKVNANAGRKQSPLTDEEKILQRKRLMAVSDDEKEQAIKYLGNWITKFTDEFSKMSCLRWNCTQKKK